MLKRKDWQLFQGQDGSGSDSLSDSDASEGILMLAGNKYGHAFNDNCSAYPLLVQMSSQQSLQVQVRTIRKMELMLIARSAQVSSTSRYLLQAVENIGCGNVTDTMNRFSYTLAYQANFRLHPPQIVMTICMLDGWKICQKMTLNPARTPLTQKQLH